MRNRSPSAERPSNTNDTQYLQVEQGLIDLHRATGVPPTVKILDGEVMREGNYPIHGGAHSDIWVGKWLGKEKVRIVLC